MPHDDQAAIEREYLLIQCDKLRGWCLSLLDVSSATPTLPPGVVRDLRENPPRLTAEQVIESLMRYSGRVRPDGPYSPAVAGVAAERERLKQLFFTLHDADDPYVPMTGAEVYDLINAPPGLPVEEVLAEFQRELGGDTPILVDRRQT